MKTATLYTVVAQEVVLADAFSHSRQPGGYTPAHSLGNGYVLAGVQQMHPSQVHRVGDAYIALAPDLRALLEAPIRAQVEQGVEQEIERRCTDRLAELARNTWHRRAWRAICNWAYLAF
jgi:hypothetical protein